MMAFPKKKWCEDTDKKKSRKVVLDEAPIQKQCNDYLNMKCIYYLRIDDGVWAGLNYLIKKLYIKKEMSMLSVAKNVLQRLKNRFAGMPDIIAIEPIGEYGLSLQLEIKSTTGKKHGKQFNVERKIPVKVSRSPEDNMRIIDEFLETVEAMKRIDK